MRKKLIGLFVLAGFAGILLIPTLVVSRVDGQPGQQGGGKKGGKKGGGGGAGGQPGDPFGGGQPGGGGKGKGGKKGGAGAAGAIIPANNNFAIDPDKIFDTLAKGGDAIVIANMTGVMQSMLTQYAQDSGISNGLINRQQFSNFGQSMMTKMKAGGMGGGNNFDPDQAATRAFQNADKNQDGYLNEDEMPGNLKAVWHAFDANKDGLINLAEYKVFFNQMIAARVNGNNNADFGPGMYIVEDDWDKRPTVFRAGKLPPGLPAWFQTCDKDNDGQVALSEWRQNSGGRTVAEFQQMDRNGDGLLTVEEVLWYMKQLSSFASGTLSESQSIAQDANAFNNPFGNGGKGKKGGPGGKKGGPGGQGGGPGGFGPGAPGTGFGGFDKTGGGGKKGGKGGGKGGGGGGFGGGAGGGGFGGGGFGGGGGGFGGGFGGDPNADPAAFFGKKGGRNGGGG